MRKILVVDDEEMSRRLIAGVVRILDDVEVRFAADGAEAFEAILRERPDLVISDVSMPELDGLTLCQRLRDHKQLASIPLMLVTAHGEQHEKYEGFLQGADDYIVKPFDVRELQLRVKAMLRRQVADEAVSAEGLAVDQGRLVFAVDGVELRLTRTELAIVRFLVQHVGQVVSTERILREALDYPAGSGSPQLVHTHVRNVRLKARQAGVERDFLQSSHQGYTLTQRPARSSHEDP